MPEDHSIANDLQTEKKMFLALSLLSSIAQSRFGQWVRFGAQRRVVRFNVAKVSSR